MKGFKNSTRTVYTKGGEGNGPKGAAKVARVMHEFKSGKLHSGSKKGPKVSNPKQAVAIALSEAKKNPMKMSVGGEVRTSDVERPSRPLTAEQVRRMRAVKAAADAAPKPSPLIDAARTMGSGTGISDADRRIMIEQSSRPMRRK